MNNNKKGVSLLRGAVIVTVLILFLFPITTAVQPVTHSSIVTRIKVDSNQPGIPYEVPPPALDPSYQIPFTVDKTRVAEVFSSTVEEMIQQVNESLLISYIQTLQDFGPRVTGSDACEEAGDYIYSQFQQMGLSVRYDAWSYQGYSDENIEATLAGTNTSSDLVFIICAHYDSVPGSPGADDDGSGTAAVLAAANIMSKYEFEHTIRFVTFSGEEQGLLGSHEYAEEAFEQNENIVAVLNADMIGYADSEEGAHAIRMYEEPTSMWITNRSIVMSETYEDYIAIDIYRQANHGGSDHYYFLRFGFDAVFFIEAEFNRYYHSSEDTLENMDMDYCTRSTRLILATLIDLASLIADEEPPVINIITPQQGYLYIGGKPVVRTLRGNTVVLGNITLLAEAFDNESGIRRVEFYIDETVYAIDNDAPFSVEFHETSFGKHTVSMVAIDKNGNSDQVTQSVYIFDINLEG